MKTKLNFSYLKTFLLLILLLCVKINAQVVYDTLYLFPDTTNFNDEGITVVEEVLNLAVKLSADSSWDSYEIEKLLIMQPNNIDTNAFDYFNISTGEQPEENMLDTIMIFFESTFPNEREILIDPPVKINNSNWFYISGGGLMTLAISDWYNEAIPNEYMYWYLTGKWIEYVPTYFYLKVVVKKDITGVEETPYNPTNFKLEQNYPNPFNPTTNIQFSIPKQNFVTLKVYDVLGREVATLVNEEKSTGSYNVSFDASSLSSGVYIYKIQAGNFINSKKMVLLK